MSSTPPRRMSMTFTNIFLQTPTKNLYYTPVSYTANRFIVTAPDTEHSLLSLINESSAAEKNLLIDFLNDLPNPISFSPLQPIPLDTPHEQATTIQSVPVEWTHAASKLNFGNIEIGPAPRVYESPVVEVATCHGCRHKKPLYRCHNVNPPTATHKMTNCAFGFCESCIDRMAFKTQHVHLPSIGAVGGWKKYKADINTSTWCCPRCHGFCTCAQCKTKGDELPAKRQRKAPSNYWEVPSKAERVLGIGLPPLESPPKSKTPSFIPSPIDKKLNGIQDKVREIQSSLWPVSKYKYMTSHCHCSVGEESDCDCPK